MNSSSGISKGVILADVYPGIGLGKQSIEKGKSGQEFMTTEQEKTGFS